MIVNAVTLAANLIGFNLIFKSYMKYIYNKPYSTYMKPIQKQLQVSTRDHFLDIFIILDITTILYTLRSTAISFTDKV